MAMERKLEQCLKRFVLWKQAHVHLLSTGGAGVRCGLGASV